MTWEQALERIETIKKGTKLDAKSPYRIVEKGPDYPCNTYDYRGLPGFKVTIGKTTSIDIPIEMLQKLFNKSIEKGKYNNGVFKSHYSLQLSGHGCHVHVVGSLFAKAGICTRQGNNYLFN